MGTCLMRNSMGLFPFLLCSGLLIELTRSQGISVIGSKMIRPNSNYTVVLSNTFPFKVQLQIRLKNQNEDQKFDALKTITMPGETIETVAFNVENISSGKYVLGITSIQYKCMIELNTLLKTTSILIQNDKPVYQPGAEMKFRVLVIDVDTRPVMRIKSVSIILKDSKGNHYKKWPYAKLQNGVFESSAVLLAYSRNWTMIVKTTDGAEATKNIKVQEMTLPYATVKAYPVRMLLLGEGNVSITIEATYASGFPMEGSLRLDLFLDKENTKPDFSNSTAISGKTTVDFQSPREMQSDAKVKYKEFKLDVSFVETSTNRTLNITELIKVHRYPYDFIIIPSSPTFCPGIPFKIELVLKEHSGLRVREMESSNVEIIAVFELDNGTDTQTIKIKLNQMGEASVILKPLLNARKLRITTCFDSVEYEPQQNLIPASETLCQQYITINVAPNSSIQPNEKVQFDVVCTEEMTHFFYVVIARGTILASSTESVPNKKEHSFTYQLLPVMAPEARIIVYFMKKEFLIFDSCALKFDTFNFKFKFNSPGRKLHVDVHAKDSYVAFTGYDDFNFDDELIVPYFSGIMDNNKIDYYQNWGVFVKSSISIDIPAIARNDLNQIGRTMLRPINSTRELMPIYTAYDTSWLWQNYSLNERNTAWQMVETVPKIIGSYYVSGFALSPTLGFRKIEQKFTVNKRFYMTANLPNSIKRGEEIFISVTVFNFLRFGVTVDVTLIIENGEIESIENGLDDPKRQRKTIKVSQYGEQLVFFKFRSRKLGQIEIKLVARCLYASDVIARVLYVNPESYLYKKMESRYIVLNHTEQIFDIDLSIPPGIDENSEIISLIAFANVRTPLLNIEKSLSQYTKTMPGSINKFGITVYSSERNKKEEIFHSFDIDSSKVDSAERHLPGHVRKLRVEVNGTGIGFLHIVYQYHLNMLKAKPSFDLEMQILNSTTYDVQHFTVCVKCKPDQDFERSHKALVQIFLPHGLMFRADAVRDLTSQIKKTEQLFANTSIVVQYEHLGSNNECFQVTAHHQFKPTLYLPSYITARDSHHEDRFAILQYEGMVSQICEICEDEDCKNWPCPTQRRNNWGIYSRSTVPVVIPWLWRNSSIDAKNGSFQIVDTVPNTIGTYYVSGFALSPTMGLSKVELPQKFVVKKQFFMVSNLPYSIKRDEVVPISVTVFNFLGYNVTANVSLLNSNEEIEFVGSESNDSISQRKTIHILDHKGQLVSFMIKSKKIGPITIKFRANSHFASDAIEQVLRVTPESHLYKTTEARLIELYNNISRVTFNFILGIPRHRDEATEIIMLTVDPSTGEFPNNIDISVCKLIGSSKQNIWNFSQNIIILEYLSAMENLTESDRSTLINCIVSGYRNIISHKRSDGSFNIWGPKSTTSSIFSTAMVTISLLKAAQYIDVDEQVVNNAFEWLASVQKSDGRFKEVEGASDVNMQGALLPTKYALTSYVLMAFGENQEIAKKYRTVVEKTAQYLVNNFHNMNDVYDLSMATYGLSLINDSNSRKFLEYLLDRSITDYKTDEIHWNRPPVDVEVAGYAVLSSIMTKASYKAIRIARWLNKQLNGLSNSSQTQGKFVEINALAKFAATYSGRRNDYRLHIVSYNGYYNTSQTIQKINSDIQNIPNVNLAIPGTVRRLEIEVKGTGSGMLQLAYQYKLNIQKAKHSFRLKVQLLNTSTYDVQHLEVCVKYIQKEQYKDSKMALVEIFLPSGLIAEANPVRDITRRIKKIERRFADTSIVVYYESLSLKEDCFQVTAHRRFAMALHMPSYVTVYDYYDRDYFGIASYEGKVPQMCDVCEDENCETLSC